MNSCNAAEHNQHRLAERAPGTLAASDSGLFYFNNSGLLAPVATAENDHHMPGAMHFGKSYPEGGTSFKNFALQGHLAGPVGRARDS